MIGLEADISELAREFDLNIPHSAIKRSMLLRQRRVQLQGAQLMENLLNLLFWIHFSKVDPG